MSDRSDIRMHVEHLFEGRVLDAETIELKERSTATSWRALTTTWPRA